MSKFFNLDSPLMNGLNKVADLMILNIITFVFCLPVVTIGASLTAMNYVALKIVRNEENYIAKAFWKSFKENFKQATIIWVIYIVVILLFVFDYFMIFMSGAVFPDWAKIGIIVVSVLVLAMSLYTFPLLARFENTIGRTIKNSALVSLYIWPKTLLMIVIWAVPVAILFFVPQILPIVLLFGISGPGFLCALLYNKAFKKFEPQVEEKDADEWFIEPIEEAVEETIEETDTTQAETVDEVSEDTSGEIDGVEEENTDDNGENN